jgi:hypothetical protein
MQTLFDELSHDAQFAQLEPCPAPAESPPRIREKIAFAPATGCWLWIGAKSPDGYGKISRYSYKQDRPHRLAYSLLVAPIPPGLEIHHLCQVKACCNPWHMQLLPHREHMLLKQNCPKGHSLNGANLYLDPRENRQCRACREELNAKYYRNKGRQRRAEREVGKENECPFHLGIIN